MNTTRTPQQASIEAKEAREAWERGEEIECSEDRISWRPSTTLMPLFTHHEIYYRPKPKTPITPGRWRMRNGEIVVIVKIYPQGCEDNYGCQWGPTGWWLSEGQHPRDLISKVETRLRPWKREEVPVGALVRKVEDKTWRGLITSNNNPSNLFGAYELINPDGSFKAPCGVEEEVE